MEKCFHLRLGLRPDRNTEVSKALSSSQHNATLTPLCEDDASCVQPSVHGQRYDLHPCCLLYEEELDVFRSSEDALQDCANAYDLSDCLGNDSCDAFWMWRFEVHTMKPGVAARFVTRANGGARKCTAKKR